MAGLLERALGDNDAVTSWVLGASRWPADSITSRCPLEPADRIAAVTSGVLGQALDAATGTSFADVRRAYRIVDGPDGAMRLRVALGQLPAILQDAASHRVNSAYLGG